MSDPRKDLIDRLYREGRQGPRPMYDTQTLADVPPEARDRFVVKPPTLADAKLIGAGDGSVLLYCRTCREAVTYRGQTLDVVSEAWQAHVAAVHPAST